MTAMTTDLKAALNKSVTLELTRKSPRDTQYRPSGVLVAIDSAHGTLTLDRDGKGWRTIELGRVIKLLVWGEGGPGVPAYSYVADQYEWLERDAAAAAVTEPTTEPVMVACACGGGFVHEARHLRNLDGLHLHSLQHMTWAYRERYPQGPVVRDAELERERAAEARHGGRYITEAINRLLERNGHLRPALAGEAFEDGTTMPLGNLWAYYLSPAGTRGTGRDTTASLARDRARGQGGVLPVAHRDIRRMTLAEAEAMVSWPIYREALTAR